jgi:small subunit ribosomal protein S16
MAVKIRLRAQGCINNRSYRLVVADSKAPRDGKYLEALGWYDPRAKEDSQIYVKPDRLEHWISKGAVCTETVELLMRKAAPGVMANLQARVQKKRTKEAAAQRSRGKAAKA